MESVTSPINKEMKNKKFKIWARNYFGFSRVEIRAMFVLMPLLLLFLLLNFLPKDIWIRDSNTIAGERELLDSLSKSLQSPIVQNTQFSDSILLPRTEQKYSRRTKKKVNLEFSDINSADSTLLKKIYGIGSKLSVRIIRYREALGGYVSMDQLYEVYYLDSSVVDQIKAKFYVSENFVPLQIKLDSASLEKLGKHPYLTYQEAKLIIAYRSQHGPLKGIEDLMNIPVFTTNKIRKLKPYLSFSGK